MLQGAAHRARHEPVAQRPTAPGRRRACTSGKYAPGASRVPRALLPPTRRGRTLRRAQRVVRNSSRTCLPKRFPEPQQPAPNPAFHRAERYARGRGYLALRHALEEGQLNRAALRFWKRSHEGANFFRAPRLIDVPLGIGTHHGGGKNIGIRIFAAALLFAFQAEKIERAVA